jgi:hypothetical protein
LQQEIRLFLKKSRKNSLFAHFGQKMSNISAEKRADFSKNLLIFPLHDLKLKMRNAALSGDSRATEHEFGSSKNE